jgi:hypothetical protein
MQFNATINPAVARVGGQAVYSHIVLRRVDVEDVVKRTRTTYLARSSPEMT